MKEGFQQGQISSDCLVPATAVADLASLGQTNLSAGTI